MKGNPTTPKCKFAQQVVELLQSSNANAFSTFDALSHPETRYALNARSDWHAFPQSNVSGE